jgi:hypothetical protein
MLGSEQMRFNELTEAHGFVKFISVMPKLKFASLTLLGRRALSKRHLSG